jgi:hypothetical protein
MRSVQAIADRAVLLDKETRGVSAVGTPEQLRKHPPTAFADIFFNGGMR